MYRSGIVKTLYPCLNMHKPLVILALLVDCTAAENESTSEYKHRMTDFHARHLQYHKPVNK